MIKSNFGLLANIICLSAIYQLASAVLFFNKDTSLLDCSEMDLGPTFQLAINETSGQKLLPELQDQTARTFYVDAANLIAATVLLTNVSDDAFTSDNDLKRSLPDAYAYFRCLFKIQNSPTCTAPVTYAGLIQIVGTGYGANITQLVVPYIFRDRNEFAKAFPTIIKSMQQQTIINLNKLQTSEGKQLYQKFANYLIAKDQCYVDFLALTDSAKKEMFSVAPDTLSYVECMIGLI